MEQPHLRTAPELIKDASTVILYYVKKGVIDVKDFSQVSQKMVAEHGESIRPYLLEAWKMAQEHIKNQPNVAEELLKTEESNKNLARHIASALKAQMLEREGIRVMITRKQRICIVISLIWLVIAMAIASSENDFVLQVFLSLGILPIGVGWGIWWIFRAKE